MVGAQVTHPGACIQGGCMSPHLCTGLPLCTVHCSLWQLPWKQCGAPFLLLLGCTTPAAHPAVGCTSSYVALGAAAATVGSEVQCMVVPASTTCTDGGAHAPWSVAGVNAAAGALCTLGRAAETPVVLPGWGPACPGPCPCPTPYQTTGVSICPQWQEVVDPWTR